MPANLQVNYAAKRNAVLEQVAKILALVDDMPSPMAQKLSWANHGDLCRIERDLEAILEYLDPA